MNIGTKLALNEDSEHRGKAHPYMLIVEPPSPDGTQLMCAFYDYRGEVEPMIYLISDIVLKHYVIVDNFPFDKE